MYAAIAPFAYFAGILAALACLGRRVQAAKATLLACVLLSLVTGLVALRRPLSSDIALVCFYSLGFDALFVWSQAREPWRIRLFYLMLAGVTLIKGVPALAMGVCIAILTTALTTRSRSAVAKMLDPFGLILFAIMALALVLYSDTRAIQLLHRGDAVQFNAGAHFSYGVRLVLMLAPWILLIPLVRRRHDIRQGLTGHDLHSLRILLWSWLTCAAIFYAMSATWADYLILAALPPAGLLLALAFLPPRSSDTGSS